MSATVIIPTTGSPLVKDAIESVLNQSYHTQLYLVVDGNEHANKIRDILDVNKLSDHSINICVLPENVGAKGFYGHRVYAAFTHLINTEHVLYLDQDCFLDNDHVETIIHTIETNDLDWCYSLRKIVDRNGNYMCNDDCESLGKWNPVMKYHHVDTNCYCIKTSVATKISQVWHGGWGQDRVFYSVISEHFKNFDCSGKYTLNYRLDGNEGSVKVNFFKEWNKIAEKQYHKNFPWRKTN